MINSEINYFLANLIKYERHIKLLSVRKPLCDTMSDSEEEVLIESKKTKKSNFERTKVGYLDIVRCLLIF